MSGGRWTTWTPPCTGTGKPAHKHAPSNEWSLLHLVYTISVLKSGWNPSPSVADHPLTWSLRICAGTRSQLDPMLFHESISVLLSQWDPAPRCYFSYVETTYRGEPREEGGRDGPKRTLWFYHISVKMKLLKLGPHTSVANAVVSAALGKVREDLTHQVPTKSF